MKTKKNQNNNIVKIILSMTVILLFVLPANAFNIDSMLQKEKSTKVKFSGAESFVQNGHVDIELDRQISYCSQFGLEGKHITSLASTDDYLFSGTVEEGLYRKNLANPDSEWEFLGFPGKTVESIYINPELPSTIYIGLYVFDQINPLLPVETHSLYKSVDDGQNWYASDEGLVEVDNFGTIFRLPIFCIDGIDGDTETLYATSLCHTFKSTDGGQTWIFIDGALGVFGYKRHVICVAPSNPDILLAGGETNAYGGYIIKSVDGGQTWTGVTPDIGGDNACYSIIIHPENPDIIYAGMEGYLLKTINGGDSWAVEIHPNSGSYFRGLLFDPEDPNHIFAGGDFNGGNDLKIWEKFDRELTQPIDPYWYCHLEEGAGAVYDIVADLESPDLMYVGTTNGIYTFFSDWNGYPLAYDNIK